MSNNAAWIKEKFARLTVGSAEKPTPGAGELLVKIAVIAFSPIEAKVQRFGTHPIPYPNILGSSFAGTVESVGPDVTRFKASDRIATNRPGPAMANTQYGAFQQYALAIAANTSKLPDSVPLEAGATSILNLAAVSSALTIFGGLDKPSLSADATTTTPKNGKKILIYGGSSSTGGLAIRHALAAGYEVVTTSSPHNHEFVQSLGPGVIIDHTATNSLAAAIRSNGPYHMILDTIGTPPVTDLLAAYVDSLGGGHYHAMIPPMGGDKPIPERVQVLFQPYNFAFEKPENEKLKKWFFEELVPRGLEAGVIVPTRAQWVEGGLEGVQSALDLMAEDKVSGRKLVLDPWA